MPQGQPMIDLHLLIFVDAQGRFAGVIRGPSLVDYNKVYEWAKEQHGITSLIDLMPILRRDRRFWTNEYRVVRVDSAGT